MRETLDYMVGYGVSKNSGELLYKKLKNGQYLTAYITNNNIDIYLLNELYEEHDSITQPAEILSFTINDKQKKAKFRELITL